MTKTGIIFDMDGTLWDSAANVARSWTDVVQAQYGMDRVITTRDIQSIMGKTMVEIADAIFPQEDPQRRMEILKVCCEEENAYLSIHGGVLYPELEETLKILSARYPLYIVSNCQSGYIEAFLGYYHFGHYFEDIQCYGDNQKPKGFNIRLLADRNGLERGIYVGDTQGDYDATMEAGLEFIYAAYGFGEVAQPVTRLEQFADLPEILEGNK